MNLNYDRVQSKVRRTKTRTDWQLGSVSVADFASVKLLNQDILGARRVNERVKTNDNQSPSARCSVFVSVLSSLPSIDLTWLT